MARTLLVLGCIIAMNCFTCAGLDASKEKIKPSSLQHNNTSRLPDVNRPASSMAPSTHQDEELDFKENAFSTNSSDEFNSSENAFSTNSSDEFSSTQSVAEASQMLRLRVEVFKKYINEKLSNMPVPKMELLNETDFQTLQRKSTKCVNITQTAGPLEKETPWFGCIVNELTKNKNFATCFTDEKLISDLSGLLRVGGSVRLYDLLDNSTYRCKRICFEKQIKMILMKRGACRLDTEDLVYHIFDGLKRLLKQFTETTAA